MPVRDANLPKDLRLRWITSKRHSGRWPAAFPSTPPIPTVLLRSLAVVLLLSLSLCGAEGDGIQVPAQPQDGGAREGTPCVAEGDFFLEEVWPKVAAQSCLECHKAGGDAEDSKLVLTDPARARDEERDEAMRQNSSAFARMAAIRKDDKSRLLRKVTGGLDHGGEDVLADDSAEYRILAAYVRRLEGPPDARTVTEERDPRDFFEGVAMLDDQRLLRRIVLSLAARLPTDEERSAVKLGGLAAVREVLGTVMKEEAFYQRLGEAFNDIFLTRGYIDGAESALSYDHFSETRHWTQKHDLTAVGDEKAQQKARYKLADDYREALLREPLELIKHIVRNERPFTEIITADYIMVSPYTSRGYGVFEELRDRFLNVADPFEYVPVRLAALKHRDGKHQQSESGFYPHAGMMSTFQYLRRYPTTETNRNRLRSRMYYQHFLGIDVLELAARVSDAAAATAKYEVPTMQAAECVVCHRTLDPVAGIFQNYYSLEGVYGPRKDGWFTDMFGAGFEGEDLPAEQRWRALQWLGERTVQDPRFATTMVEHVYYILTGRKVLLAPKGIDDPQYAARRRAYLAQRREVERIAVQFAQEKFNLKTVFQEWALSPFYRADGSATAELNSERREELADVGLARMLGPEQLERKVAAIFGKPWGRLNDSQYAILYGGIDSEEVTERAADPSGAMGAIQRTMANDVACRNVPLDFAAPPEKRRLFPEIEPDVLPGVSPEADQQIRQAVAHLHQVVLGRDDAVDAAEVDRTFTLFTGIVGDAKAREGLERQENYSCRVSGEQRVDDPQYTLRAWRAVVTYLLRQRDFLYE